MAGARIIKRRIKTSKNIAQVTRALEMVSAVKMRKAQEMAMSGRLYNDELEKMLRVLSGRKEIESHQFLQTPNSISHVTILVVAPSKGLAGPLVTNLTRSLTRYIQQTKVSISIVSLGRKAKDITKHAGAPVSADFGTIGKNFTPEITRPAADYLIDQFKSKKTDLVMVAYTHFVNTVSQKATVRQFLPILPTVKEDSAKSELALEQTVLFEPSAESVLDQLFTKYSEAFLYQLVLENNASEHSARMVAMKNAHDNAVDIISDLTLSYNKARQNSITSELADIVSSSLVVA